MATRPSTAPTSSAPTVTIGVYLAERLQQLGVERLFGLPGDFNLTLLDEMLSTGIAWVGSANELNAAYAADAAARVRRGPAAICVVSGVGELSAVNGIAGAYAEDVPVISIVGCPAEVARTAEALLHHSLVDGDHGHFVRATAEVTAESSVLTAENAGAEIDRVLQTVLTVSKPVSINVPADVAVAQIPAARLREPLQALPTDGSALEAFREHLARRLQDSTHLTLLVGQRSHRARVEPQVAELAEVPGVLVATQAGSKGVVDESHPASLGIYLGAVTLSEDTRRRVDEADPLILVGTVLSDLLTRNFTHRFDSAEAVELGLDFARVGDQVFRQVGLADSLTVLQEVAVALEMPPAARRPSAPKITEPRGDDLTQRSFWSTIQAWLPPDTYVIADAGTAFFGAIGLRLPPRTDLIAQPVWASIGYSVPATLGAALSDPGRRCVCLVGDGAAQLTIQELGVILQHGLDPIFVVLDNAGYTIERAIQSPDAVYQDVAAWDWERLPDVLAPGVPVDVSTARTVEDLSTALLDVAESRGRAEVIRVILPRDDVPEMLARFAGEIAAANRGGPAVAD